MPLPTSSDLDRHTHAALDALLVVAGAIQERSPQAPQEFGELRACVGRLLQAGRVALPEVGDAAVVGDPQHVADLAIGRIVGALWRLDVAVIARELAQLSAIVGDLSNAD